MRETSLTLAIDVWVVSATNAVPPSRAARESRTISVPAGSDPVRTMIPNPPHRSSSSAARSEFRRLAGRTRIAPSSQNWPVMVPSPSIHAARSPFRAAEWQAARRIAVAPPCGIHTESLPRGNPPPGKMASSAWIPVATGSAVRCVTGVASGNLCSRSDRRTEEEDTSLESEGA
jgi:hypothetical protein